MLPCGAVTVKEVVVDAVTVALVDPKNTMLLDAVVLKLFPLIVMVVPAVAEAGENEVITGGGLSDSEQLRQRQIEGGEGIRLANAQVYGQGSGRHLESVKSGCSNGAFAREKASDHIALSLCIRLFKGRETPICPVPLQMSSLLFTTRRQSGCELRHIQQLDSLGLATREV